MVYQAELKDKNGDWVNVAIKTLKDDPDEKFWKDFLNEIKLLQQITNPHKNVVKFIGAVTADMVKTSKFLARSYSFLMEIIIHDVKN